MKLKKIKLWLNISPIYHKEKEFENKIWEHWIYAVRAWYHSKGGTNLARESKKIWIASCENSFRTFQWISFSVNSNEAEGAGVEFLFIAKNFPAS